MKFNIKLFTLLITTSFIVFSCGDDDKIVDGVFEGTTNGAVLRTISINASIINTSDPNSLFSVSVEEQDVEDGALFESIDLLVSLNDLTPDNGTTVVPPTIVKNIPASEFTTDTPFGLPRGDVNATFAEIFAVMGIDIDELAPGDALVMDLYLNLSDGRVFNANNTTGVVTGGFFGSPFRYNALLTCSPAPGIYTIEMRDAYGDGWQTSDSSAGNGLIIDIDGTIVQVAMCSQWGTFTFECAEGWPTDGSNATDTVTIPEGAESATWTWSGDFYGEISFDVYGPDDQLLFTSTPGNVPLGLLPIVACAQ